MCGGPDTRTHPGRTVAAAIFAACALAAAGGAPAARAASRCDEYSPIGDLDGRNGSDVVVGLPSADGGRGAIALLRDEGRRTTYTAAQLGLGTAQPGDRLGAAVVVADVDRDGCTDVLAGAPGREGRGAVVLVRGARTGLTAAGATTLATGTAPGDGLGGGLAAGGRGKTTDLWMGAPGARGGRGEVVRGTLVDDRLLERRTTFAVGSELAPGVPSETDRFGETIAATFRGALVGLPNALGPNGEPGAGAVVRLRLGRPPARRGNTTRGPTNARPDAPPAGTPRRAKVAPPLSGQRLHLPAPAAGDHFGATLATDYSGPFGDNRLAGAPAVDVAGLPDAGAVAVLRPVKGGKGELRVAEVLTQADPRVPGAPTAGGGFGTGIATGRAFAAQIPWTYAIGAPGQSSIALVDDGAGGKGKRPEGSGVLLTPGTGLPANAGAGVGSSIALVRGRDFFDEDTSDGYATTSATGVLVHPRGGDGGREFDVGDPIALGDGPLVLAEPIVYRAP